MHANQALPPGYIQHQPTIYNPWHFSGEWSRNLCDCKGLGEEGCYSFWCHPCFSCQLAWRMNESCWITCCVPGYIGLLRSKMRTRFGIKGSYLNDFCVGEFCSFCAGLQMAGELRARNVIS